MRILIIGVNGFIGRAIAAAAGAIGHEVVGVGRSAAGVAVAGMIYQPGNRSATAQMRDIVQAHKIDVVVDVLAMTLAQTQPLLDSLAGIIDQYVMLSSSDVYANYALLHKRAVGEVLFDPATEDSALRTTAYPYRGVSPRPADDPDQYLDDYDKIPIEAAVQQSGFNWTVLRLPMVYGPGDQQHRFRWAVRPMLRRRTELVLPRLWAEWQTTYGYVDNVGAAVGAVVGRPEAHQQIYNVAEATTTSQLSWARKFAEVLPWEGEIVVSDDPAHPMLSSLAHLDLSVPFKVSGQRFRQVFGDTEVVDPAVSLALTAAEEAAV